MNGVPRDARIAPEFFGAEHRHLLGESERLLLGQVFRRGRITQGELTDLLPLSQQSISRMAQALELRGMIRRGERQASGQRGQPSAVLTIAPGYAYTVGASIMADGLSLSLVNFAGETAETIVPKLADLSRASFVAAIRNGIARLLRRAEIDRAQLFGLGVAISGFRVEGARFNTPASLEELALVDLEAMLADALDLPVWAENDGKAATIGENMNGVGRRIANFAYYFIATGVGGGVIVDGRLLPGARGNAGEFVGVLPIEHYPFPNLELLRQRLGEHGVVIETVSELVARYDDAWPGIDAWIAQVAPSLSLMASATAAILDTDAIVLGGRIPAPLAERLIPHIRFYDINRRDVRRARAEILPGECAGDATSVGAALLPLVDKFFAV